MYVLLTQKTGVGEQKAKQYEECAVKKNFKEHTITGGQKLVKSSKYVV